LEGQYAADWNGARRKQGRRAGGRRRQRGYISVRDVGGGVPHWQDAALLLGVAAGVEGDAEGAVHAGALLDPVAHVLLLLLRALEGDALGEDHLLVALRQPGYHQGHLLQPPWLSRVKKASYRGVGGGVCSSELLMFAD